MKEKKSEEKEQKKEAGPVDEKLQIKVKMSSGTCRAIMIKGMVFRNTWVYSKEDTMAHTRRLVVTS